MYDGETSLSADEARTAYAGFLRDTPRFKASLRRVVDEWPKSCEHFLTNEKMNRVAWLGQAAMAMDTGVSRKHRAGFMLLNQEERATANATAQEALDDWTTNRAVHRDMGI